MVKAAVATASVDTVAFETNSETTVEITGGADAGTVTLSMESTGVADHVTGEAKLSAILSIEGQDEGNMKIAMETYITGEWLYAKISLPIIGVQWLKSRLTDELKDDYAIPDLQIDLLKNLVEVNYLRSELLDDTDCYVIGVIPDTEAIFKLMQNQFPSGMEDMSYGDIPARSIIKDLTMNVWIAKGTHLLAKSEIDIILEISNEHSQEYQVDFDKTTMTSRLVTRFYDYNEEVSIELPEEALDASEITSFR